ncbi:hypothetical protein [Gimesia algae]|uniref:Uncharacterized protein n=1 Tax=Gimesia algae TaxID=2527971 RepID=A0A517VLP1_9PLAN|nr:hypothetical protein [Gimesia algae]QDT93924.1 hypothetical protein Pan161_56110 [Gimesia algae]
MEFPILAAGDDIVGVIVGVIFLLISAVSAFSNIAKEKNKPQPGKVKKKAALQKELEKFLQDAMNPQAEKKKKPVEVDFFEDDVQATTSVQQPPPRRRREKQNSQPQGRRAQQAKKMASQQKTVKEPKVHVSARERAEQQEEARQKRLGGSMRARIEKRQKKHLQSSINSKLDEDGIRPQSELFGSRESETRHASDGKRGGSRQIRDLLRNRQSFQQAIILNEILSPPLSRRRS